MRPKFRIYRFPTYNLPKSGYCWTVRIFDGTEFWVQCKTWQEAIDEMHQEIKRRGCNK